MNENITYRIEIGLHDHRRANHDCVTHSFVIDSRCDLLALTAKGLTQFNYCFEFAPIDIKLSIVKFMLERAPHDYLTLMIYKVTEKTEDEDEDETYIDEEAIWGSTESTRKIIDVITSAMRDRFED